MWFTLDRSYWNPKSDAATRREEQAKRLFDAFLERCSAMDGATTPFPVRAESLIPATMHLTGACYTTFNKYVKEKGCSLKRREATSEEKKNHYRKRYVISAIIPVHPSKLDAYIAKRDAKNAAAKVKRDAKKAEAAEQKAKVETLRVADDEAHKSAVAAEFASILNDIDNEEDEEEDEEEEEGGDNEEEETTQEKENDATVLMSTTTPTAASAMTANFNTKISKLVTNEDLMINDGKVCEHDEEETAAVAAGKRGLDGQEVETHHANKKQKAITATPATATAPTAE